MKAATFERLRSLWCGSELELRRAGREIYEFIPGERQPEWIAAILLWATATSGKSADAIQTVIDVAGDARRWYEGHDVHGDVRSLYSPSESDEVFARVLCLADTGAKVIYNASGGPAPFDRHAGWRIAEQLREFVDICDGADESDAWNLLVGPLRHGHRRSGLR